MYPDPDKNYFYFTHTIVWLFLIDHVRTIALEY